MTAEQKKALEELNSILIDDAKIRFIELDDNGDEIYTWDIKYTHIIRTAFNNLGFIVTFNLNG